MKRRVVLHGPSTLTVSLPASWTKKFNIRKGDELEMCEIGNELRVSAVKSFDGARKNIFVGNLKRVAKSSLTASYRLGYDEIFFNFDNPESSIFLQELAFKELIGLEVVKQGSKFLQLRDITGHEKNEFDIVFRRIWLLLIDLSRESLLALKKKNIAIFKSVRALDLTINKFSNYCLRILMKRGHESFNKTPLYYHFVKGLEIIADHYKDLCIYYSNNIKKIDTQFIKYLEDINDNLEEFWKVFNKFDEKNLEVLFSRTKKINEKILNSRNLQVQKLSALSREIRDLLPMVIEINL